ncbi:MAG: hypothetical protein A2655_03675 [Candidatus Yanofskybacteria bacterium RIFCSPHIGHO2_01_FULL_43_42]|uniref:Uncharacterized protein n=1 Tax=Candidatus Yanofskybacteria bacterium RIFCSPLOWO2_01_FULL_43_22 TaxID=1802695 RepID=A0A1F8GHT8_9BACT|nr:MAG: hypothetical protein A2655_03675 [Candidatus Yanofskybacteria bacterium RIFCSPHIGHO2_01_FULL_43_42]OGN12922.1 MAG: hypothetical protein A3D48_03350 [Candidatus Yanofskybacteria bacterium RIFCSPHIGHO2_02_FULL_43_17]OGN23999.1 MAG: hypothetical protein A3A13_02915 [Candidatus Yanofskybacteria bacterium RIFCSPLOWO2_01_FULL_43_22]
MAQKESRIARITRLTAERFPSFGGAKIDNPFSPIQPVFAFGVDIEKVVRFVLSKRNATERAKRDKIGNDARDISYTSELLKPLSSKALGEIERLGRNDAHRRLKEKIYPFSQLNYATREKLLHLPISWLHEGAQWQLNTRKPAVLLLR